VFFHGNHDADIHEEWTRFRNYQKQ
jgi:hypothetical protein